MRSKPFKKGSGRFIQLEHWFYDCPAWQSLKPGPRNLYIELKRHFNGCKNGHIFLSQRNAGAALNIGRDTVGRYFVELEVRRFITKTEGHYLGSEGEWV